MFKRKDKKVRNDPSIDTTLPEICAEEDVDILRIDHDGAVKLMANEILGLPTHVLVGHKNGNPYDNRRCNLYIIDPERN